MASTSSKSHSGQLINKQLLYSNQRYTFLNWEKPTAQRWRIILMEMSVNSQKDWYLKINHIDS